MSSLARNAAALAAALTLGLAEPGRAAEPTKPGRGIRVRGHQFVDAAGRPVIFRGVAISDPDELEKAGHWSRRIE